MLAPKRLPVASLRTHSAAARPPQSSGGEAMRSAMSRPRNSVGREVEERAVLVAHRGAARGADRSVASITASRPALRFHEQAMPHLHAIRQCELADRIIFDLVRRGSAVRRAAGCRGRLALRGNRTSTGRGRRGGRRGRSGSRRPTAAGPRTSRSAGPVGIVEGEVGGEHLAELARLRIRSRIACIAAVWR